jgi:photosystem II stability/assembly factor-like uncharacterized protein
MKAFTSTLRLSLIALMICASSLHAQWNTLAHDATINRSIRDVFFVSSTGYAAGWRADGVPWGTRGLLYKTTDGGQTWNFISIPLSIGNDSVMGFNNVHFVTALKGFASASCYTTNGSVGLNYGAIVKTADGGQTWTPCFSSKAQVNYSTTYTIQFNHVFFDNMWHGVISASRQTGPTTYNGVTYNTNNGGTTWNAQVTAYAVAPANASFFTSPSNGCVAGGKLFAFTSPYNGRIAVTTNGGNSWSPTFFDSDYGYADINFPSSQIGYAVGDSMYSTIPGGCKGKLVKTTDGGINWNAMAYFPNFRPICVFFITDTEGYIGGETAAGNSGLLKTIDGGVTWTPEVYPDIAMNSLITSITFSTPYSGYASNSYTNSNSIYGNFALSTCGVYAGNDTTFCQSTGPLYATPTSPGSDYVFSWSPSTGLSDSTSQSPYVFHAHNQQYVVTMTDTVTNCVATDTIIVSAYNMITPSPLILVCPGDSFLLDFGPGASNYNWQFFTDTNQVTTTLNINSQTLWVSEPGYYGGFAMFPGCGALTSYVGITDTGCVASVCAVNAGPDTSFCQQQGQLSATPASPGSYTFSWSPATGLDNPNAQNPNVISGVSNQQYIVTMTDASTSCVATDTVIVSAYYFHNDSVYSCFPDSALLDFGPGASNYFWQFFTDTNNVTTNINASTQTYYATAPGTYGGIAMFTGCGALTSVFYVIDSCITTSFCAVNAGPDTTFCQQHGNLTATPASPGNYTYSWSPANGLDDPFSQNPNVISGVHNQQYVVTMTDTAANCTATDTVIVSAYYFHVDTVYNCNSQPVMLDHGPGATYYIWQFYTDPQGNTTVLNQNTQTYLATAPGTYSGGAIFPGCGALTSVYTVIDSCSIVVGNVWPGDCNYDLTANMADALHIGLAYGATGATRPNASNLWYAQPMADWTQNYANCNYKHGDADGNGTIDVNDTLPISLNYGSTHPFRLAPQVNPAAVPELYLVANYDTVGLQTLVTVDVRLGTSAMPVDSLYGISFRLTADAALIDTNYTIVDLNSTWLGTTGSDMFNFRKYFTGNGSVDCAESRNDHTNYLNGNGTIATFLIVTTDNLSGIAICHIDVTDVTAVTVSQHYLTLATVNDSVVIDPSVPAGMGAQEIVPSFNVYPNPAHTSVTIQTNTAASQIEITDMLGRVITTIAPTSLSTTINTETFAQGVYLLRVKNGNSVTTQKLSVMH